MPTARQRRAPGTQYITPGKTKQHEDYWTAMHHIDVFYLSPCERDCITCLAKHKSLLVVFLPCAHWRGAVYIVETELIYEMLFYLKKEAVNGKR
jgi:hypothetical protein